jgi:hypothetical protein
MAFSVWTQVGIGLTSPANSDSADSGAEEQAMP